MELDLYELQYLLSRFPDQIDDLKVRYLKEKIEYQIQKKIMNEKSNELSWFTDPNNQQLMLREFLNVPPKIRDMMIKDFFFSYEKSSYIRLGNILSRRGLEKIDHLLDLTIYKLTTLRGIGENGQKSILTALIEHSVPEEPTGSKCFKIDV
ncbi:hypothetical protein [Paenibacillus hubeiensis]|uniref:hypothetical protein n=1 Tax=Paenibacillus hubeiensis TaxID=3077330 RepID=UPI0031BAFFD1